MADVEVAQYLLRRSEDIRELVAALCRARPGFVPIHKGHTATVRPKKEGAAPYTYNYASLDQVIEATAPALSLEGIAIFTTFELEQRRLLVRSELHHISGQWIAIELPMPMAEDTAQSAGAAITYARRYALQALLNIHPEDEDDDGAAATEAARRQADRERAAARGQGRGDDARRPPASAPRAQQSPPTQAPPPTPPPAEPPKVAPPSREEGWRLAVAAAQAARSAGAPVALAEELAAIVWPSALRVGWTAVEAQAEAEAQLGGPIPSSDDVMRKVAYLLRTYPPSRPSEAPPAQSPMALVQIAASAPEAWEALATWRAASGGGLPTLSAADRLELFRVVRQAGWSGVDVQSAVAVGLDLNVDELPVALAEAVETILLRWPKVAAERSPATRTVPEGWRSLNWVALERLARSLGLVLSGDDPSRGELVQAISAALASGQVVEGA